MSAIQGKRSILVVEDDGVLARLYRTVLVQRGWEVAVAATEPDGVAAFLAARPPVVLTDYRLPRGNGISMVEQIKKIEPRAEAVLISGYLTPDLVEQATRGGMFECLRKPVELAKILQTVDTAFLRAVEGLGGDGNEDLLRHIRSAVDSTAQYAVAIDSNYSIVASNTFFRQRFGDAVDGMKCYEVISRGSRVCPGCRAVAALESGRKCRLSHPPRMMDGVPTEFEEYVEPFQGQQNAQRFVITLSEVEHINHPSHNRRLATPACQEHARHDDKQQSFLIMTTLDGKMLYANEVFQRVFLGESEPDGQSFFDFCDRFFLSTIKKSGTTFRKWIDDYRTLRVWCENRLGNRVLIDWEFNIVQLSQSDEPVVVCTGYDRGRLQAVQRWAQFYDTCYREIFRYQFGMVLVCDSERRIIAANERLLRALEARPREIIGRYLKEFVASEEDGLELDERSRELRCRPATEDFRIRIQRPNGSIFSALASLVSITNAYNVTEGYALVLQDIEEQEKLEQMLGHIEELYNLGGLSAGIAHQMNNCLCAIINWAELLKIEPESAPPPEAIIDAATRMQQLSGEILQLARKSHNVTDAPFNVNHTLETLALLTARRMKQDAIDFQMRLSADLPNLRVSEAKLEHVLLNLVTNAVESFHGIELPSQKRQIVVSTSSDAGHVYVDVADTGPGIPDDILEKVFERFFTTKSSGTGLGLSLSLSILDSIGGQLTLVKTGPDGTVFRVSVPH